MEEVEEHRIETWRGKCLLSIMLKESRDFMFHVSTQIGAGSINS